MRSSRDVQFSAVHCFTIISRNVAFRLRGLCHECDFSYVVVVRVSCDVGHSLMVRMYIIWIARGI